MQVNRNVLAVFIIGILAVSCGSAPAVIDTPAEFSGVVLEILPNPIEGFKGWIIVESPTTKTMEIYKVTINDDTAIFKLDGDHHDFVDFEALELNQQLELWFTLLNLDSFPAEAVAEQVIILP